jgi:hypothetical protein
MAVLNFSVLLQREMHTFRFSLIAKERKKLGQEQHYFSSKFVYLILTLSEDSNSQPWSRINLFRKYITFNQDPFS